MPLADYHVHTRLCNHATGSMGEFVEQACALGLEEMAFLDHLTLTPGGQRLSMSPHELGLYHLAARRLARQYQGRIRVRIGIEIDYFPQAMGLAKELSSRFDFDVLTASVHFVDGWNMVSHKTQASSPFADPCIMAESYLNALEGLLEDPFFDVIGHLDIFKKFSGKAAQIPRQRMECIIKKIADAGLCVEINTSGLSHGAAEIYPSEEWIKALAKAGVGVTLGSDAHAPKDVGRAFEQAADLLLRCGHTHFTVFSRRVPQRIAL
ncbi:MAG: histidinol-phosphatase [Desulfatibacillaceae bacterium]|nr:histidinol-phosphatase [Desulfatibacillaceae bacterium]